MFSVGPSGLKAAQLLRVNSCFSIGDTLKCRHVRWRESLVLLSSFIDSSKQTVSPPGQFGRPLFLTGPAPAREPGTAESPTRGRLVQRRKSKI